MGKKPEYKVECFIRMAPDQDPVPFHTLSAAEVESVKQSMSDRLSRTMSEYFSQHMDEYQRLNF